MVFGASSRTMQWLLHPANFYIVKDSSIALVLFSSKLATSMKDTVIDERTICSIGTAPLSLDSQYRTSDSRN
jgi:hypothetical protein